MGVRHVLAAIAAAFVLGGTAQAETTLPALAKSAEALTTPRVLSPADVRRYREILRDERRGHFKDARKRVAELSDRCLMGYVEAEHYLSPHSGRSTPAELNGWLRQYGDLSIADRIRDLSKRRTKRKGRIPPPPHLRWRGGGYEDESPPDPPLASAKARAVQSKIEDAVQDDKPDTALALLKTLAQDSTIPTSDLARLARYVSASYLVEGDDRPAYDLADSVAASIPADRAAAGLERRPRRLPHGPV